MEGKFRILERVVLGDDRHYINAACKSGTTKPTGNWAMGSSCLEVDTGKVWWYDEDDEQWLDPKAEANDHA